MPAAWYWTVILQYAISYTGISHYSLRGSEFDQTADKKKRPAPTETGLKKAVTKPVLIYENTVLSDELVAHMNPMVIDLFNTAKTEQQAAWVAHAKANHRIGFTYQPLEQ